MLGVAVLVALPLVAQAGAYWAERRAVAELARLAQTKHAAFGRQRWVRRVERQPAHEGDAARELLEATAALHPTAAEIARWNDGHVGPDMWERHADALAALRRAATASMRTGVARGLQQDELNGLILSEIYLARGQARGAAECLQDVVDVFALRDDARLAGTLLSSPMKYGRDCATTAPSVALWDTASALRRLAAAAPTRAVAERRALTICASTADTFRAIPPDLTTPPGEWSERFRVLAESRAACVSAEPDMELAEELHGERVELATFVIALEILAGRAPREDDPMYVDPCATGQKLIVRSDEREVLVRSRCTVGLGGGMVPYAIETRIPRGDGGGS